MRPIGKQAAADRQRVLRRPAGGKTGDRVRTAPCRKGKGIATGADKHVAVATDERLPRGMRGDRTVARAAIAGHAALCRQAERRAAAQHDRKVGVGRIERDRARLVQFQRQRPDPVAPDQRQRQRLLSQLK